MAVLSDIALRNRGIVTRRQARDAGVKDPELRELVLRGAISRLSRGVYRAGSVEIGDPRAVTERHKLVLSHVSAAAWYAVDLPHPTHQLTATAPRNRGQRKNAIAGVDLRRSDLGTDDVLLVKGVLVTSPARTVIDIARDPSVSLDEAVAIADGFLRTRQLTMEHRRAAASSVKATGRGAVMLMLLLVDPHAGSVLESLCRVLLWRAGIEPPR